MSKHCLKSYLESTLGRQEGESVSVLMQNKILLCTRKGSKTHWEQERQRMRERTCMREPHRETKRDRERETQRRGRGRGPLYRVSPV